MAVANEGKSVVTCNAILIWDGVTQPELDAKTQQYVYSVKVALPENAMEKMELENLATSCLRESKFKGMLPPGGNWPIMGVDMMKFQPEDQAILQGRVAVNAKTRFTPEVFDAHGNVLQPMQYKQLLYPGATVKVLVSAYAFDNVSKGVAFSLDGIQIVDSTTKKIEVGGGMSATEKANAFMSGGSVQQPMPNMQQPMPNMQQPMPNMQQPMPNMQQPMPNMQQPMPNMQQPMPQVQPAPEFLNPGQPAMYQVEGNAYSKEQLLGWGWSESQIANLPRV